jgi:hypothetical protein
MYLIYLLGFSFALNVKTGPYKGISNEVYFMECQWPESLR